MFNLFPYTDMHELNLDWAIAKIKELDTKVDTLKAEITAEASEIAYERAKAYVDENLSGVLSDFAALQEEFNLISEQFIDITGEFNDLVEEVNNKISYLQDYINAQIGAVNIRTDAAIAANNEMILSEMATYLGNIKVLNYFTGEYVSIQDMFDYLAQLHLDDSIDYNTMITRAKTYSQLIALNMTYTNLAMHGNTLYI